LRLYRYLRDGAFFEPHSRSELEARLEVIYTRLRGSFEDDDAQVQLARWVPGQVESPSPRPASLLTDISASNAMPSLSSLHTGTPTYNESRSSHGPDANGVEHGEPSERARQTQPTIELSPGMESALSPRAVYRAARRALEQGIEREARAGAGARESKRETKTWAWVAPRGDVVLRNRELDGFITAGSNPFALHEQDSDEDEGEGEGPATLPVVRSARLADWFDPTRRTLVGSPDAIGVEHIDRIRGASSKEPFNHSSDGGRSDSQGHPATVAIAGEAAPPTRCVRMYLGM
jgi:hypothetical protein